MRHDDELSGGEVVWWTALGVGSGLLAAVALSGWVGDVNRSRVRRVAGRLRESAPTRLTASASVRAVETALRADPRLAGLTIEARAVSRGAVELRGWVPSRSRPHRRRAVRARGARHRKRHQQHSRAGGGRHALAGSISGGRPERMTAPLAPQYDPSQIEAPLYAWWRERGLFDPDAVQRARGGAPGEPYVIQMPPPNVTAELHAGHGLNNTVQDVLIRFERMRGRRALWVPGTDHAGIATQNVVERLLAKEGLTRFDLGREAFVERVWAYVRQTGARILEQLQAIGCSADWSRTYFTLDEDLSRAVREVFVACTRRAWSTAATTSSTGARAVSRPSPTRRRRRRRSTGRSGTSAIRWRTASGHVTVATTRPETMLGDTAVAVHPDDERYRRLVGKELRLPLTDRLIPVVADEAVDPAFGSGAVKVTPAHDPTDFEIGRRHELPTVDVMTPEARMSLAVPDAIPGAGPLRGPAAVVDRAGAAGPAGEGGDATATPSATATAATP